MAQYDKRENTQCNARVTAHGEGPRRRARRGCFAAACTHGFTRRTADLVHRVVRGGPSDRPGGHSCSRT